MPCPLRPHDARSHWADGWGLRTRAGEIPVPLLSVVAPLMGDVAALETTLVSVLSHRPADCEVIVVLASRYEDPYDLAGEEGVRLIEAPRRAGLVDCWNAGVGAASAPVVHLLRPGYEVAPRWADAALARLSDPLVASVACVVLDADDPQRVMHAGVDYLCGGRRLDAHAGRSLIEVCQADPEVLGASCAAGFFRKSLWDDLGGLAPALGGELCDVDLALRFLQAGYRSEVAADACVYTRWTRPAKRGFRSGRAAERLFWRNVPVYGWSRSLTRHALVLLKDAAAGLLYPSLAAEMLGRAWALLGLPWLVGHHRFMQRLVGLAETDAAAHDQEVRKIERRAVMADRAAERYYAALEEADLDGADADRPPSSDPATVRYPSRPWRRARSA